MKSRLYTVAEVRKIQEKASEQAIIHSVERVYEYVLLAMLDNGVSQDVAKSVMHTADSLIDAIVYDDMSVNDIRDTLKNEYGLEIEIIKEH